MNTHYTCHLYGGETVRPGHDVDALVITSESSTVGIFLSLMPAADQVRFLRELSEAARELADEITLRDLERAV